MELSKVKQELHKTHGEDHSWFSGYVTLPNEKQMSLAVIVENGGKGSEVGAVVAKDC